jgi:hypothetical protein
MFLVQKWKRVERRKEGGSSSPASAAGAEPAPVTNLCIDMS